MWLPPNAIAYVGTRSESKVCNRLPLTAAGDIKLIQLTPPEKTFSALHSFTLPSSQPAPRFLSLLSLCLLPPPLVLPRIPAVSLQPPFPYLSLSHSLAALPNNSICSFSFIYFTQPFSRCSRQLTEQPQVEKKPKNNIRIH